MNRRSRLFESLEYDTKHYIMIIMSFIPLFHTYSFFLSANDFNTRRDSNSNGECKDYVAKFKDVVFVNVFTSNSLNTLDTSKTVYNDYT